LKAGNSICQLQGVVGTPPLRRPPAQHSLLRGRTCPPLQSSLLAQNSNMPVSALGLAALSICWHVYLPSRARAIDRVDRGWLLSYPTRSVPSLLTPPRSAQLVATVGSASLKYWHISMPAYGVVQNSPSRWPKMNSYPLLRGAPSPTSELPPLGPGGHVYFRRGLLPDYQPVAGGWTQLPQSLVVRAGF